MTVRDLIRDARATRAAQRSYFLMSLRLRDDATQLELRGFPWLARQMRHDADIALRAARAETQS